MLAVRFLLSASASKRRRCSAPSSARSARAPMRPCAKNIPMPENRGANPTTRSCAGSLPAATPSTILRP